MPRLLPRETDPYKAKYTLTDLRAKYSLSMAELGEKVGIAPATVFQWEHRDGGLNKKQRQILAACFTDEEMDSIGQPKSEIMELYSAERARSQMEQTKTDRMQQELLAVFDGLDNAGREELVDYADYLYQKSKGFRLPRLIEQGDAD